MLNKVFKGVFVLIGLGLFLLLYGIYTKLDNGRFIPGADGVTIDTKTGNKYFWSQDEGYQLLSNKGELVKVKHLPYD